MPVDRDEQPTDAWGAPVVRGRKAAPTGPTLDLAVPPPATPIAEPVDAPRDKPDPELTSPPPDAEPAPARAATVAAPASAEPVLDAPSVPAATPAAAAPTETAASVDDAGPAAGEGPRARSGNLSLTLPETTAARFDELVEADRLGLARNDLLVAWVEVAEASAGELLSELAALVPVDEDGRALVRPRLQAAPSEGSRRVVMWIKAASRERLEAAVERVAEAVAVFDVTTSWVAAMAVEHEWARRHGNLPETVAERVAHVAGRR